MSPNAINTDPNATCSDASCIEPYPGCTDGDPNTNGGIACNYDPLANVDNGSCNYISCAGCTTPGSVGYDASATIDDGSCGAACIYGCMDNTQFNYNPAATCEATPDNPGSGECIPIVTGCTDTNADNWSLVNGMAPNTDDGSCQYYGCTDPGADNYDSNANVDDGSCNYLGCTDPSACNFDPNMSPPANVDDGSCTYLFGCMDPAADNFDVNAECSDGSCIYLGCTDPTAFNYDNTANTDDGSCVPVSYGCTDPTAFNYDASVNTDDGSCEPVTYGCIDPAACNYVPGQANTDDGSCSYTFGCDDPSAINYDPNNCPDPTICEYQGCMNVNADNYDPNATVPGVCLLNNIEYGSFVYDDNGVLSVDLTWGDGILGCPANNKILHYGPVGAIASSTQNSVDLGQLPTMPHTFTENDAPFSADGDFEWRVKCKGSPWNTNPPSVLLNTFTFTVNPFATAAAASIPPPVEIGIAYTEIYSGSQAGAADGVQLQYLLYQAGIIPFGNNGIFGGNNGTQWVNIPTGGVNPPNYPGTNIVVKRWQIVGQYYEVIASTATDGFNIGSNSFAPGLFPGIGVVHVNGIDLESADIITLE